MGHVLIVKGSRFPFSHDFSPLLLTQTKNVLHGKSEVGYYLWTGFDENGNKVNWPEMFTVNYIKRPEILESTCLYKFVQKYVVRKK